MMKKLICLGLLMIVAGCGQKPIPTVTGDYYPVDLKAEVNNRSMTLMWKKVGAGAIAGYNIYVSDTPLAAKYPDKLLSPTITPHNAEPFPGDTDPDDGVEHFDATQLDNGVKYYVSVRVAFPDGSVSRPSNEVTAVTGPRGTMQLDLRYKGDHDGFSFEANDYVRADNISNDLYFFAKDGRDYLASPKRLDGFIRDTHFYKLPQKGHWRSVFPQITGKMYDVTTDQIEISRGDWILLKCDDGTYGVVQIEELLGSGEERSVKVYYAYSALGGELFF